MSERNSPPVDAEYAQPLISQLAELQQGRELNAIAAAEALQRRTFAGTDRINNPDCSVTRVQANNAGMYDDRGVGAAELIALEALGVAPVTIFGHASLSDNQLLVASVHIPGSGAVLSVYSLGPDGISLRLTDPDNSSSGNPSQAIKAMVAARFSSSPIHAEIHRVTAGLSNDRWPREVATSAVDAFADPLAVLAFLQDSGYVEYGSEIKRQLRDGASARMVLERVLDQTLGPQNDAGLRSYEWGLGAVKRLEYDPQNHTFTFACRQVPADMYGEKANQSPIIEDESQPFVLTEHAKGLLTALDAADLMIAPTMQARMMDIGEADRFGSVYTQMTREVAKWVDRPDRFKLSNLFVPKDASQLGRSLVVARREGSHGRSLPSVAEQDNEALARERLMNIDITNMTLPMRTLVDLARQVAGRGTTVVSDIPVTTEDINFLGATCFDTYTYFLGAPTGQLALEKIRGVTLLRKTYGKQTYLCTAPTVFNGIRLPQGSLFQSCADGKWAFLRLTPFTFDDPADQQVFGSEVTKSNRNYMHATAGRIGGVSLAALARRAAKTASFRRFTKRYTS